MDVHRLTLERFRDWLKTEKDSWFLWYYLLHGNSGAIAWPEGWFYKNEGGAAIDLYILGLKDVFKTVQGDMSLPFTSPGSQFVPDPIGIYYSQIGRAHV